MPPRLLTRLARWAAGKRAFVVLVAGFVMGFGARWSGGCTSGHGLRGCSSLSPASLAAMGTFMATAVAVTAVLHFATGGSL